jgi:spore germination cell wall hydrolase CwlJ-like protein
MAKRLDVAPGRTDIILGGTLLLIVAFTAAASTNAPPADQNRNQTLVRNVMAPLPLVLAREQPANSFATPVLAPALAQPITFAPTPADLALEKMLAEQRCLAEAMYYEARGEGIDGEKAIAEVVFHRMKSAGYPHSICGVVYQGAALKHACQFSFTCSGQLLQPKMPGAWQRAKRLAARILGGLIQLEDVTEDAVSFHAAGVQPGWGERLIRTIQIGNHVFYRAAARSTQSG